MGAVSLGGYFGGAVHHMMAVWSLRAYRDRRSLNSASSLLVTAVHHGVCSFHRRPARSLAESLIMLAGIIGGTVGALAARRAPSRVFAPATFDQRWRHYRWAFFARAYLKGSLSDH